jgi:ATP-dependent RNA helicase DDX55/SPB4
MYVYIWWIISRIVMCGTDVRALESKKLNVLVGTPGRVWTLLKNPSRFRNLNLGEIDFLVLDEADRLLNMGFAEQLNGIFNVLGKQRRTGLFSATQGKDAMDNLIRAGLRNSVKILLKKEHESVPESLQNTYIVIDDLSDKMNVLFHFLVCEVKKHRKIIVYVLTCAMVDYLGFILEAISAIMFEKNVDGENVPSEFPVFSLHGKMHPKKRNRIYQEFQENSGIMITTDVAARGIDLPDVDLIVQ